MRKDQIDQLIKAYLDSPVSDIEKSIGRILFSEAKEELASIDDKSYQERVSKYLDEIILVFRDQICDEWKKVKETQGNMSNIEIIAAIADLISGYVGIVPVFMVATLIFKRGIDNLCPEKEI